MLGQQGLERCQFAHREMGVHTTEDGSRPSPRIGHLLILLDQFCVHACDFDIIDIRNGGRIERVYTLLAIPDGNSSFVLAQAIVILPARLRTVRSTDDDLNIYLLESLRTLEHMSLHTGPVERERERKKKKK